MPLKTELKIRTESMKVLKEAAKTFVKDKNGVIQIWAASRDWFLEEWGRDTFISLPGLLLATGRFEDAKNNIRNFAKYEKDGLIPNRLESDDKILFNSVDAPMWFIQAIKSYYKYTDDQDFVEEMLPIITNIIEGYKNGTGYQRNGVRFEIKMDHMDGLIISPPQATWMDADPSGEGRQIITPRNGKAVEINALWYSNLRFLAQFQNMKASNIIAAQVKGSFIEKFWNTEEKCLYDVIEGDPHKGAIRPNMIFAISHGEDLLPLELQKKVFKAVTKDLLTPYGLRTLSPRDSNYIGEYNTNDPMSIKDLAYHQGTVWPWLIGPYCDALVKIHEEAEVSSTITPLCKFCLESPSQSLPEVFSGNPPYLPGGTSSQAWSVAEVLRVLVEYKLA